MQTIPIPPNFSCLSGRFNCFNSHSGIKYMLVSETFLSQHTRMTPVEWLLKSQAEPVAKSKLHDHAGEESEVWMLLMQ